MCVTRLVFVEEVDEETIVFDGCLFVGVKEVNDEVGLVVDEDCEDGEATDFFSAGLMDVNGTNTDCVFGLDDSLIGC